MDQYLGDDTFKHIKNTIHAFDVFWQLDHVGPILISSEAHIFGAIRHLNADLSRVRNGVLCSGYDPYILQPISTHWIPGWKQVKARFQRFQAAISVHLRVEGSNRIPYRLPAQPGPTCEILWTETHSWMFLLKLRHDSPLPPFLPCWVLFPCSLEATGPVSSTPTWQWTIPPLHIFFHGNSQII
jgi:hypothetical protein